MYQFPFPPGKRFWIWRLYIVEWNTKIDRQTSENQCFPGPTQYIVFLPINKTINEFQVPSE